MTDLLQAKEKNHPRQLSHSPRRTRVALPSGPAVQHGFMLGNATQSRTY